MQRVIADFYNKTLDRRGKASIPPIFRFTVGKDGAIYAWCMTVPKAGDKLKILSLGSDTGIGRKQVTSVELLGEKNKIEWKQEADGLNIVYPDSAI